MPSANLMSAVDMYNITPGQYSGIDSALINALSNKKALDEAVRRHRYEMERVSLEAQKKEQAEYQKSKYQKKESGSKEAKSSASPNAKAASLATQILNKSILQPNDNDYNKTWQDTYTMILDHLQNEPPDYSAAALAGGETVNANINPTGQTLSPEQPSMFVNPFTEGNQSRAANPTNPIDAFAGRITGRRPQKSVSTNSIPEGATATNPKTGKKLKFKGGQWVPQ